MGHSVDINPPTMNDNHDDNKIPWDFLQNEGTSQSDIYGHCPSSIAHHLCHVFKNSTEGYGRNHLFKFIIGMG